MNANLPVGMATVEGTFQYREIGQITFREDEWAEFTLAASRLIKADVEAAQITAAVRGLPPEQAVEMINHQNQLAAPPEILIQPSWWKRLPFLTFRMVVMEE